MRHFKVIHLFILVAIATIGLVSCSDDNEKNSGNIAHKIELEATVTRLNEDSKSIQQLIVSLLNDEKVTDLTSDEKETHLTYSSEAVVKMIKGKQNPKIPTLSVHQENDTYFWVILYKGNKHWLEKNGTKIPVYSTPSTRMAYSRTTAPFVYPIMGTNEQENWTIDLGNGPEEFLDENKEPVKAIGDSKVSLISFNLDDANEIFVQFNDDVYFSFKRTDVTFSFDTDEVQYLPVLFNYDEEKTISFKAINITDVTVDKISDGWSYKLNNEDNTISLIAPKSNDLNIETEASITLKGKDKNDITYTTSCYAYTVDYTHPLGTFVVLEGNMTSENGNLGYFDQYMRRHDDIYEVANNKEHGNVLQDIFIANDKIYLINQNGPQQDGAERFEICDGRTMKVEYEHPMAFLSDGGIPTWPQHIIVAEDKLFIQYSTSDMELSSGIRVFDLKTKKLEPKDIEGTYGAFTKDGALKGRMVLSRGKIFAGLGSGLVIIDPIESKVIKTITYEGQVKGIVKAADNNIYIAVAGNFTGSVYSPSFTSNPQIIGINHEGIETYKHDLGNDVQFPVATWSPGIGLAASFNKPHIYLATSMDFTIHTASRFNYETKVLEKDLISTDDKNLYGYMGIHPTTENLFVGTSPNYLSGDIFEWKVASDGKLSDLTIHEFDKASPAGMDFAYRFTPEFINK